MSPHAAAEVAVIGAGWSGLAAAVRLVQSGVRPVLIDAAPQAGGRARGVDLRLGDTVVRVDNGQHLIVGAYAATLALIGTVADAGPGHALPSAIRRQPMRLQAVDGLSITPLAAPAPLDLLGGLLRARGLTLGERWALVRQMAGLRLRGWRVPAAATVAQWLTAGRQPRTLVERFWVPLCLATLNTPADVACAQTFANVLRDTLGRDAAACDFILPRATLDEVLPTPALAWLQAHGASAMLRWPVRSVSALPDSSWQVSGMHGTVHADQVILALPPANAARVLRDGGGHSEAVDRLNGFVDEPIATVYLAWRDDASLQLPAALMLTEEPGRQGFGQWLFDRGVQHDLHLAAVVVSARGREMATLAEHGADPGTLAQAIGRQVADQLGLPMPLDARMLVDKRATFRCVPERPRLTVDALQASHPRVWLAGDYAWSDYPATLEAAVCSGNLAAERCLAARG